MRPTHRLLLLTVLLLLLLTSLACAVPGTETRVLLDGPAATGWAPAEATLTAETLEGTPVQHFRVPVDWTTGEPNYPIGWPRISLEVPAGQQDWRGWEQLHLRVRGRSSAGSFPARPFGITMRSGRGGWEREVPTLPTDRWQEFTFDLSDLPGKESVNSVGVYVSEDTYPNGTVLDFYLARLELVRYTQPTLRALTLVSPIAFADAKAVAAEVELLGVKEGADAPVELSLLRGKTVVAKQVVRGQEGETQASLSLPHALPAGDYTLAAAVGGRSLTVPLRLVTSPWQEAAR